MLTFLVLGYIPGTHTQLSFNLLLAIAIVLFAPYIIVHVTHFVQLKHRTHQLLFEIISI